MDEQETNMVVQESAFAAAEMKHFEQDQPTLQKTWMARG